MLIRAGWRDELASALIRRSLLFGWEELRRGPGRERNCGMVGCRQVGGRGKGRRREMGRRLEP